MHHHRREMRHGRYATVADAERDGFKKFFPGVPLPDEAVATIDAAVGDLAEAPAAAG